MTDQYAVVGNPIKHSKSPTIHHMFAAQTGQEMNYAKIESPMDDFEKQVAEFFARSDGKGLNVTVPFKERAWRMCEQRSECAERAGAVNTLYMNKQGELCGENTDGLGLVADIKNHGVSLKGKKILILGAGGAVRGVLQPILEEQPETIVIANRTVSKAEALVELFSDLGSLKSASFETLEGEFDLIINGTSASLSGDLPPVSCSLIGAETIVYDMMYGAEQTVFNRWASEAGARLTIDGLGMLVGQAAEAFYLWRGIRPSVAEIMRQLRVS